MLQILKKNGKGTEKGTAKGTEKGTVVPRSQKGKRQEQMTKMSKRTRQEWFSQKIGAVNALTVL